VRFQEDSRKGLGFTRRIEAAKKGSLKNLLRLLGLLQFSRSFLGFFVVRTLSQTEQQEF
jgi:hypothetical protein